MTVLPLSDMTQHRIKDQPQLWSSLPLSSSQQFSVFTATTSCVVVTTLLSGIVIGWIGHHLLYYYKYDSDRRRRLLNQSSTTTLHKTSRTVIADDPSATSTPATTAYESLIGNTPCIRLPNISQMIQRCIYIKCEQYNPSHSGKDRAALHMIQNATTTFGSTNIETHQQQHVLVKSAPQQPRLPPTKQHPSFTPKKETKEIFTATIVSEPYDAILQQVYDHSITGGILIEGTSGSTGISLAHIAVAKGYGCIVVLPDDQASMEKQQLLHAIVGTYIHIVPPASISSPNHYVNIAKAMTQRAVQLGISAVFIDQFNNRSNYMIHYTTTGPEIWNQCQPNAFVMSAGTGGTISGVAKYLKEHNPHCRIVLADPVGSVLFGKVEHGIAYTSQQQERTLLRHRYDSIAEGIGLDRITDNVDIGLPYIDSAITISDQEIVNMAHFILREEGLMIGSSTAINIIAAITTATQQLPIQSRVCTMFCDSGQRHVTRLWNRDYILSRQLSWPQDNISEHIPECLRNFVSK